MRITYISPITIMKLLSLFILRKHWDTRTNDRISYWLSE